MRTQKKPASLLTLLGSQTYHAGPTFAVSGNYEDFDAAKVTVASRQRTNEEQTIKIVSISPRSTSMSS